MLIEYIEAAMAHAVVAEPAEGVMHVGTIDRFTGLRAEGTDRATCLANLRVELERWILFRVARHLSVPEVDGLSVSFQEIRTGQTLLDRLYGLERQLHELAGEADRARAAHPAKQWLIKWGKRANEYWALLSFAAAVLVVAWVFWKYDVAPLEEYRKIKNNRDTAGLYRQLGDEYLAGMELKAAANAYKTALGANPNDLEAARGLFKAEVFKPLEGEKYERPEVVDARIQRLTSLPRSAHIAHLFEGIRQRDMGNYGRAEWLFAEAVRWDKSLVGGHIELGATILEDPKCFDLDQALGFFAGAYEGRQTARANYYLGYVHLLKADFDKAVSYLEASERISPRVDTAYLLGEAYRHKGHDKFSTGDPASVREALEEHAKAALSKHAYALSIVLDDKNEEEDFLSSRNVYHYLPDKPGASAAADKLVFVSSFKEQQVLLRYALSIDFALLGDLERAQAEFDQAMKLDAYDQFRVFAQSQFDTTMNFLVANPLKTEQTYQPFEHRIKWLFCQRNRLAGATACP
jgi:tetratricopeptide (TPR) repeat protein